MYNRPMPVQLLADVPLLPPARLGPYRSRDYEALADEPRCELLYGELVVTPAPAVRHQAVVSELGRRLHAFARARGGLALMSPVDVALFDHSVVQPDVVYISANRLSIARRRFEGVPDLLIEVLSPDSARRDRLWKLRLYAEAGVREYWIVDPEAKTLEFLILEDGHFRVQAPAESTYRSPAISGLELDLGDFWAEIDQTLAGTQA